jgi:hypothetical protein
MTAVTKVNLIRLGSGHQRYHLDEVAYVLLSEYLEWTRTGLRDEPEREEALCDLEGLIGTKLAVLLHAGQRIITRADMEAVFADLGTDGFLRGLARCGRNRCPWGYSP